MNRMLAAQEQYRLLCDADLSVPIEQVERLMPPRVDGADEALGSREAPVVTRYISSRVSDQIVHFLVFWLHR